MNLTDRSIPFDGSCQCQARAVKFLGIFSDGNLSWKPHISHICNKDFLKV